MISEILIKNVIFTNKETVVLNLSKFKNIDELISDKVIKKIYHYFYQKKSFLRSAKIQILINQIRESNFKHFNLSNMLVKKVNDSLIFTKKTN